MPASASKSGRIIYRNRLADWLDKWLFFGVFAVGSIGIVMLKQWTSSQWVITAFPLLVMLLYAVYVFTSRRYRLREDIAGDSLYYLGFLYTLTSLACSLYAFTQDEGNTQAIISNFGIALATTILGMALRVLFNQMREDPVEVEREARLELSEAVVQLKTELDNAVLEFNSFRRAAVQSIDEGQKELQERMSKAMTDSITLYEEVAKGMVDKLEALQAKVSVMLTDSVTCYTEVGKSITGKIETAFVEFADYSVVLNKIAKGTVTATKRLLERVERIEAPSDLLEKKFTPAVEKLLTSIQQTIEGYNQMYVPQFEALVASMQQAAKGTTAQAAQIMQLQHILNAVVQSAQTLEKHLTAWRTKDEYQAASIARELESLQQTLSTFRSEVEQNGQLLSKVTKGSEAELEAVRMHRQALEVELNTSRKLVGEVHTALVSMTSLVVEKLNGC